MIRRVTRDEAPVPISVARGRLFELVEDVLTHRADRVTLSHKGHTERVLLVRAADVARLEAEVAALRARVGPEPRPLRGLGTLRVDPGQLLVRTRARQAVLAAAKRRALVEVTGVATDDDAGGDGGTS